MNKFVTVREALSWLESSYGTSDMDKLLRALNDIRARIYLLYGDAKVIPTVQKCFQLQEYCFDCNSCSEKYVGVTLPRDAEVEEGIWYNTPDNQVTLFDDWRAWSPSIEEYSHCGIDSFAMAGLYSTERDIEPCGEPRRLKVIAQSDADCGKIVTLRGPVINNRQGVDRIILDTKYNLSENYYYSLNQNGGVVLPEDSCGEIWIAQEDDRVLSKYAPKEKIPGYRRLRLTGLRPGCDQVNVRYTRRNCELHAMDDVVELANKPAIDEFARYLRIQEKPSKTGIEIENAKYHLQTAISLLFGQKQRETGNAHVRSVNVPKVRSLATQLTRRRR